MQVGGIAEQSSGALGAMAGWLLVRARWRGAGVLVTLTDQASSFRASPSIPPSLHASHRHHFDPTIVCQIIRFIKKERDNFADPNL